ncbi:hypothetical protein SMICM304S_11330 [Streptomyces microflavus]
MDRPVRAVRAAAGTGAAAPVAVDPGRARALQAPANSAMADALRRAGLTDPKQGGRGR